VSYLKERCLAAPRRQKQVLASREAPRYVQIIVAILSSVDSWIDDVTGEVIMSFLINGVGFHILIHALPVQVAGQSSLTGVVFRSVGLVYIVDLGTLISMGSISLLPFTLF